MKKRIIASAVAIILALSVICSFCSCDKTPVLDGNLKDRFVYLIEESKELNTIFFGAGLPVYFRDNEYTERLGVYLDEDLLGYNRVQDNSSYLTIDSIKIKAENVFAEGYLAALYETAFDGVMTGESSAYLRFYDNGEWLYQNIAANDFELKERIYDYSTMQIVKPSSNEYINVTLESYTLEDRTRVKVTLSFKYERGSWYLDSPTY